MQRPLPSPLHPPSPTTLVGVFALSLGLHLLYLWQIYPNPFFLSPVVDAQTYHERAMAIAGGMWWEDDVFWQPPLYPYMLGLIYYLQGEPNLLGARLIQAVMGASTVVMTTVWAGRLFGAGAARVAGLLLTCYGPLLFINAELLSPVLTLFLNAIALIWLTPPHSRPMSLRRWTGAGLVLGLSALCRPDITLVVGGLTLLQLWRRQVKVATIFLGCFLLATTPATLHNHHVGEEWVWISSNSGVNFYLGNGGNYDDRVGIRPGVEWRALMRRPIEAGVHPHDTSGQSQWWTRLTLGEIQREPMQWAHTLLQKVILLLGAPEVYRNLDLHFFVRWAPILGWLPGWGLLFPLALLGGWVSLRRGHLPAELLLWCGGYSLAILLYFVAGRYRLPLVPLMCGLGGVGLIWLWENRRTQLYRPLLVLLGVGGLIRLDPYQAGRVNEAEGYNLLGKAQAAREDYPAALSSFRRAAELDPDYVDPVFNVGRTLQLQGKPQDAIPFYIKVLEQFPRDAETRNNLGVCYLSIGQAEKGLAQLHPLLDDPLASVDLAFNVAQGEVQRGNLAEALRVLEKFEGGSIPQAHQLRSDLERVLQGRPALLMLLAHPPGPAQGPSPTQKEANNQAHQALSGGNPLRAELLLQPVLMENPGYTTGWLNLGQIWLGLGESRLAALAFRRVREFNPHHPTALLGLAYALGPSGPPDELIPVLQHFLEVAPNHPRAGEAQQMLREQLGKLP